MKMRVADYIAEFLASKGVRHVFLVTGGGAMHLNDAFGRCKGMEYVPCHHEQACAIAAESYCRLTRQVAAVNVTTGPGGINALNGVYGAYVDSIAMFVVSGQVKWETLVRSTNLPLRQLGDQEVDIVAMAKPVTKYATIIERPEDIRYQMEKAWHLCVSGRQGPVWVDVPINIQAAMIDPSSLRSYDPAQDSDLPKTMDQKSLRTSCEDLLERLSKSERPVILAGTGIRIAKQERELLEFAERLGVPVATAWNAHDLVWDDHPLYVGRPGTVGDRPGNFAVQNSDFLLVLGCRLAIRQISYNWKAFAREAFKVMVDVDGAELKKPTLNIDLPIHSSLEAFFKTLNSLNLPKKNPKHASYLEWCKERKKRYPVVLPEYRKNTQAVNPYIFAEELFKHLPEGQKVVAGDGTASVVPFQAAWLKKGQRFYTNAGCASMGYDLPAAVGAAVGLDGKENVICIAGDGSIMMNLQELQTIQTLKLPVHVFILNNQGYHSIRQTQSNYFPDNIVGCGKESKLGFPDFEKIGSAFGFKYFRASNQEELPTVISKALGTQSPVLCEIMIDLRQQFSPKLASRKLEDGTMVSSPLEDLAPFLDRDELKSNLLIQPWKE